MRRTLVGQRRDMHTASRAVSGFSFGQSRQGFLFEFLIHFQKCIGGLVSFCSSELLIIYVR